MKVPPEKQWDSRLESQGETVKAYAGFCVYRDMGTSRSLDAAWRLATKDKGGRPKGNKRAATYWNNWSAEFHWKSRVAAYDDYQEKKLREEREREEAALRKKEREETSRIRRERIKQMKDEQWKDSCRLRELFVSAAEYYCQNPQDMSAAEMVKIRDQSEALRAKALDLVEMTEHNAIAVLSQSDFLPEEVVDVFAEVWENASQQSREGVRDIMTKRYALNKSEDESDDPEEEFLEEPEHEAVF